MNDLETSGLDVQSVGAVREFVQQHDALLQRLRTPPADKEAARVPVLMRAIVVTERVDLLRSFLDRISVSLGHVMTYAVKGGHLPVVQWLYENAGVRACWYHVERAAERGYLDVVRYFLDHPWMEDSTAECRTRAMCGAASNGRLDLVKFLHEQYGAQCPKYGGELAASNGHLPVIQFLIERCSHADSSAALTNAAESGHVDIVQYFIDRQAISNVREALMEAISNGHSNVVQMLIEYVDLDPEDAQLVYALSEAAASGHVSVLELVHQLLPHVQSALPNMEDAASNGHLDVVRFLAALRSTDCSSAMIEKVAGYGHLHVLEFLHQHCAPEYTVEAMDRAAGYGHLEVVRFFHMHSVAGRTPEIAEDTRLDVPEKGVRGDSLETCLNAAMCRAATYGHLDVLKFLLSKGKELCACDCVYHAAVNRHLSTVEFVMARRDSPWSSKVPQKWATKMVASGHVDVLQYFLQHHRLRFHSHAMAMAASNGHLEMVKFVHEHQLAKCTKAAMGGHFDVVKFLHNHRQEGCTVVTMDYAAHYGNLHMCLSGAENGDSEPYARMPVLLRAVVSMDRLNVL
ncbi:TPA: hypothetical protein N0F65_010692 [Lagenidium giganteum]|uniref:Ankyrin repeat protein n=1 Tax=Lagenidium giganteum TaxID=4803 RepID=A0AAV2ZBA4_9STRA|nr:TPA: hypothetical protein N0F65_010692 [Lagenidium giganteum]